MPPLYRLSAGSESAYAMNDAHREELMKTTFKNKKKVEVSRFKGLGEMPAAQLKETTMNPETRTLIRVTLPHAMAVLGINPEDTPEAKSFDYQPVDDLVDRLMGKNAEARFNFIQENAEFVRDIDI
jgi:topoisomerase-4 subunit B